MPERSSLLLPLIVLTVLLPAFAGAACYGGGYGGCPDRVLLREFLEGQYVEEVGLLRAATTVYPDNVTCYVANDNVLASRALAVLGSPLAPKVAAKLSSEFGGGWNGKVDVLLGRGIPDAFYAPRDALVGEVGGYRVVYERPDRSRPVRDWYRYADLLVYYALDKLLEGRVREAERAFVNLTGMWDGYGFRDKAYGGTGVYSVFKCALFVYLFRSLEAAGSEIVRGYESVRDRCLEVICRAQDAVGGGIRTDYVVSGGEVVVVGDMNTETTSIVVLALYSGYPEAVAAGAIGAEPSAPLPPGAKIRAVAALSAVILASVAFYRLALKSRQRRARGTGSKRS